MNPEVPFIAYVFLSYMILDVAAMLVGTIRMTLAIKKHPLYTQRIQTPREMDEAKVIIMKIIDEKMYLPHHKMLSKRTMEDAIEIEKKKLK